MSRRLEVLIEGPPKLRDLLLHDAYIHAKACRGLAGKFFRDHERRMQGAEGDNVQFRFLDVVYFFAFAAASGVVGNLAYDALKKAILGIRDPNREMLAARFESVVRASVYNRLRREHHPGGQSIALARRKIQGDS